MKFLGSQLSYFFANRRTRTNVVKLLKFIAVLVLMYVAYSILFHYVSLYEGQEHSWITGFYWVLVTMSTLGFGDIVFSSDLGRAYSMLVLFSGVLFLLVMLPFTFIEFFYAPWMKAMNQARAPKKLPQGTHDHVIITNLDAITEALIRKLAAYKIEYAILEPDLQKALDLADAGYTVVNSDPTDYETYHNLCIEKANLVVATGADTENTNVAFTVREFNKNTKIVATAVSSDSVDILQLAGANYVLQMGEILGRSLARRTLGGNARVHVIGHIDELVIGESTAQETPLVGKTLKDSRIRESTGASVVGIWERGKFSQPMPDTLITDKTVLVLAGTVEQLRNYDELVSIYHVSDKPVVIIGAGRVGRAAAKSLEERHIDYRIIDKNPDRIRDKEKYILGDAADHEVLKKAGIEESHTALITTHDDDINIYLTIYSRRLCPNMQIISRATYEKNINTMHRAGADFVMSYATMGANSIFNILEGQDVLTLAEGLNIFNHKVKETLAGKSLIESDIRKETGCTVLAINCNNKGMLVSPAPDHRMKAGEELILIGSPEGENDFNYRYEKNNEK
ncbi:potassium channel family protein [Rhodohalobacter mucosus]|uniref:Potassium transporter TrkA n=1 Tax=Rhodohalobacter mucosus TaxID=2079485 RepID=A0A316TZS9_9BACT|nr:NAD-binding protein [Rhodohalobacter mucosus]PWN05726.1 potassium transporter TrkA [Rhodohalobacter mucosus]